MVNYKIGVILYDTDRKLRDGDIEYMSRLKSVFPIKELPFNIKFFDIHTNLVHQLEEYAPDFILNLCDDGLYGIIEYEIDIQAICEYLRIPYSGSDAYTIIQSDNKAICNAMCNRLGIPVAKQYIINFDVDITDNLINDMNIEYPIIVKLGENDGSLGIDKDSVCGDNIKTVAAVKRIRKLYPNKLITIDEFLDGDEFTLAFIGNGDNVRMLPILKLDFSKLDKNLPKISTYEAKFVNGSEYKNGLSYILADYSPEIVSTAHEIAMKLIKFYKLRDYGRFDFRMNKNGDINLLEFNPNTSWVDDADLSLMYQRLGLTYGDMIHDILKVSMIRHKFIEDTPLKIDQVLS